MRHARLKKRAELLDVIFDYYIHARKRATFPRKVIDEVVDLIFPESNFEGRGFFKEVHRVRTRGRDLVLKISNSRSTKRDVQVYRRLPEGIRNRYFAKIYWATKYCLLQKRGTQTKSVPEEILQKLKGIGRKYGLQDIRPANIARVDGKYKIIDANPR